MNVDLLPLYQESTNQTAPEASEKMKSKNLPPPSTMHVERKSVLEKLSDNTATVVNKSLDSASKHIHDVTGKMSEVVRSSKAKVGGKVSEVVSDTKSKAKEKLSNFVEKKAPKTIPASSMTAYAVEHEYVHEPNDESSYEEKCVKFEDSEVSVFPLEPPPSPPLQTPSTPHNLTRKHINEDSKAHSQGSVESTSAGAETDKGESNSTHQMTWGHYLTSSTDISEPTVSLIRPRATQFHRQLQPIAEILSETENERLITTQAQHTITTQDENKDELPEENAAPCESAYQTALKKASGSNNITAEPLTESSAKPRTEPPPGFVETPVVVPVVGEKAVFVPSCSDDGTGSLVHRNANNTYSNKYNNDHMNTIRNSIAGVINNKSSSINNRNSNTTDYKDNNIYNINSDTNIITHSTDNGDNSDNGSHNNINSDNSSSANKNNPISADPNIVTCTGMGIHDKCTVARCEVQQENTYNNDIGSESHTATRTAGAEDREKMSPYHTAAQHITAQHSAAHSEPIAQQQQQQQQQEHSVQENVMRDALIVAIEKRGNWNMEHNGHTTGSTDSSTSNANASDVQV